MYIYALFFSLFFLNTSSISAQTFIKENSQWDALGVVFNPDYSMATVSYRFDGDTLINGETYNILWRSLDEFNDDLTIAKFLRETSDGKVYDATDVLQYDFSLSVGDTIEHAESIECLYYVSAIDTLFFLDESPRKRWEISYVEPAPAGLGGFLTYWIEGVGSINNIIDYGLIGCSITTYISPHLTCYHENDELLYQIGGPCIISSISESAASELKMTVFPNPANTHLRIQLQSSQSQPYHLKIANLDGKIMELIEMEIGEDAEISIDEYPKGIYFLQLATAEGILKTEKFVVQ